MNRHIDSGSWPAHSGLATRVHVFCMLVLIGWICPEHSQALQENPGDQTKLAAVVDTDWLEDNLTRPDVRVIDLAHRVKNYKAGHIPGAAFVDWRSDIIDQSQSESYAMPGKQQFESLLGRLGITPETILVLTDNMDCRSSIRMYLTLRYFGHDRVCVLNGGTNAWQSAGGLTTTDAPEFEATEYRIDQVREEFLTSMESVRLALEDDETVVIDGRPTNQYTGEAPGKVFHTGREHRRRGHISTAINIPWKENFNDDGTFKSLSELQEMYSTGGVEDDQTVKTYCNEGLHATVPWFVLHELLGRDDVQVYDLSMGQWANRDDTEMTEGEQ